jgi:DNA-binding beta-propeller fold protein YncE/mono/diheme cytochrome c family protein
MQAIALIDPGTGEILRNVRLAGPPGGIAWSGDGKQLFAAESGAGGIAEINPETGKIARRIPCGRYPRGLAVANRRKLLLAGDWGLNHLSIFDLTSGEAVARIPVGCQPTSVAITPDESLAVVSNLLPATAATDPDHATEVSLIDLQTLQARPAIRLPLGATNARGVAVSPDGRHAYITHALGRFHLPTTQLDRGWVNTNACSIIDLESGSLTATVLLDQIMDGAADPWGAVIDPQGLRLYITLSGVHQLAVIDLDRLPEILRNSPASLANDLSALHRHNLIRRIELPAQGPRGISISPDGKRLAIAGYFSGNVILLDENAGNPIVIPLGPQAEPDLVRRGEMVFHDANRCHQRWLSCATCHPDARSDGLNWDLLNDGIGNPKNTRSMLLSHSTPPVMSLGVRASMEVAARAGFTHILFAEPKPDDLKAVIAYLKSLEPAPSPHLEPDGSLSAAANRGREIFHDPRIGCADCHSGSLFTDLGMSDVGTSRPQDAGATRFDTPTLVELWRNPPYLHDGGAATIRDVLTGQNRDDRHGSTSFLNTSQIDDLAAYLLSL